MDTSVFDLAWCQGYNGTALVFLETNVICYQCGRHLRTVPTTSDRKPGGFVFKESPMGPVAFHQLNKHIAIAESTKDPKIYVYAYPSYTEVAVLEGGAELEFQAVAFSESDYLASVSGIPDFSLTLWNYLEGAMLLTVKVTSDPIKILSFNKTNWRQICTLTSSFVTLWNVEQCNKKMIIFPHKIRLPSVDAHNEHSSHQPEEDTSELTLPKSNLKESKYIPEIMDSAMAGLVGDEVEMLDVIRDSTERVQPVSLSWLPTGDFYVGCEGGQLFKVNTELLTIEAVYYPPASPEKLSLNPEPEISEEQISLAKNYPIKEGSLQCIAMHQTGLYAAGVNGEICLLDIAGDEIKLKETISVGFPITALTFNPSYQVLAWGSPHGTLQYYTCGNPHSVVTLQATSNGNFVGVGALPLGSDLAVSLRENGLLQVWKITDGSPVGEVDIIESVSVLACSRIAQYAVAGTKSGCLYFVDLTNPQKPRIVMRQRLFRQNVRHLLFNGDAGTLLFASSGSSNIFVLDARATANFDIIGHIAVTGKPSALATFVNNHNTTLLVACNNNHEINGANLLFKFVFSDEMIKDISPHFKSAMNDIKEESCKMLKMGFRHAICSMAIGEGEVIYAISANTKRLLVFALPDQEKKLRKIDLLLNPTAEYPGHQLPGGKVIMSPHLKWLLTYAPDGRVKIRTTASLDRTAIFAPCEYRDRGVRAAAFSDDYQYIMAVGFDGTLSCYHWNRQKSKAGSVNVAKLKRDRDTEVSNRENNKLASFQEMQHVMSFFRRASEIEHERKKNIELAKQKAQDRDEIYVSPPPSPSFNATWLEQREIDLLQQEGQHFKSVKHELRIQIRDIRKTIQQMMAQNDNLPDIEKLSRNEFDLDLEEQNRLQAEGEAEIQKVREDIEFGNLAKLYLREKIKEECWEKMKVKGRAIQAFNSGLEVSNFPLRERSAEMMKMVRTVSVRRRIEMKEFEMRKQLAEITHKAVTHEEEGDNEETEEGHIESQAISGSLGAEFGGANDLFYRQFELHCREQKIAQIVLLEDAIHRIKESYNKEFDDVYSKKEQEISKVKEKNKRIASIIKYLSLEEEVPEPSLSVAEKPELLFQVHDSEIKAVKYLTPEQQKQLEEAKRLEEERLARERGDNARDRALDMMMGGVLEIKREDELKKDVPKPTFVLTKKEEEFSEDEQKQFKEYLKKVQELNEEREKFKKQLETELRKLQSTIEENFQSFDDVLNGLFLRKIKVMMVVFQEELKILRLRYAMLLQEEIEIQEKEMNHLLEHKKHKRHLAAEAVAETKKGVEMFRSEYDQLLAEDKYLERSFKREFNETSAVLTDVLYKQFKKRPRTHKYRAAEGKSQNPFNDRPSSAIQLTSQKTQLHTGLEELDKISNAPEGMEHHAWEKMCRLRRTKVESEIQLKIKAGVLAEMQSFLHKRQQEDEKLKAEIDELHHKINKLKEDEQRFILNLEIQLLLKQGQIEVDAGPFIPDFRDSVLIHRSVVEDLNTTIKQLGESKIASMVESKDFRKGIIQLEWEHKKMSMEMEDLESKMKDIQFIKVTREIQAFLQEEDYEAKKAAEIATLEQTITVLKKQHEKNVSKRKYTLKNLHKGARFKEVSNDRLFNELLDLNVVVNERRHIEEVNGGYRDDGGVEKRYKEIKQRRKLVDLAKAQAQEIAVLRAEVERLRMRTFPALVQVER